MDQSSTATLKLLSVFLLASTNIACLQGNPIAGEHGLRCMTDYLFTINCTLRMANTWDSNSSYWLTFNETFEKKTFNCMLTNTNGHYFCSVKTSDHLIPDDDDYSEIFSDTDVYTISLRKQTNGTETRKLLDGHYRPAENIKPNAPSCLAVAHNASRHHFTWNSTYEEYGPITSLIDNLQYELNYFTGGDKSNGNKGVRPVDISIEKTNIYVDDEKFVPGTEYTARVRSRPNQAFFEGEWSDWSSEVQWKTAPVETDPPTNTFIFDLGIKVFIPLCVMVPLVLLLCYAPVKKWKQGTFIPTPAPYFDTLYSDCQGDFKSWVITQENTADMLKAEATLQIDTLDKCADVLEEDRQPEFSYQFTEGSGYSNIADPVCDSSLLGFPYAVSTMAPLPVAGSSLKSLTLSSEPGSPAEGDSGCWLYMSLEKDSPWYCNEYCTLSAFQQTSLGAAEHHRSLLAKSWPQGIIRMDATGEAQNICMQ